MQYVYDASGHEFIKWCDGTISPGPHGLWGDHDINSRFIDDEAAERSASVFWPELLTFEEIEEETLIDRRLRERREDRELERACNDYQNRLLAMEEEESDD